MTELAMWLWLTCSIAVIALVAEVDYHARQRQRLHRMEAMKKKRKPMAWLEHNRPPFGRHSCEGEWEYLAVTNQLYCNVCRARHALEGDNAGLAQQSWEIGQELRDLARTFEQERA